MDLIPAISTDSGVAGTLQPIGGQMGHFPRHNDLARHVHSYYMTLGFSRKSNRPRTRHPETVFLSGDGPNTGLPASKWRGVGGDAGLAAWMVGWMVGWKSCRASGLSITRTLTNPKA